MCASDTALGTGLVSLGDGGSSRHPLSSAFHGEAGLGGVSHFLSTSYVTDTKAGALDLGAYLLPVATEVSDLGTHFINEVMEIQRSVLL